MKRSEINRLISEASEFFKLHYWTLPPNAAWDVTDFGLNEWQKVGLVAVNLAQEPEYCEKLMYLRGGMEVPSHCHRVKKEDIICRVGQMKVRLWSSEKMANGHPVTTKRNGVPLEVMSGSPIKLEAGERVTIIPGQYHTFTSIANQSIIGEVSTANDDENDNFFADQRVGRFSSVEEDQSPNPIPKFHQSS